MIFGGQQSPGSDDWYSTWGAEAHHCGFSPEYAERLFRAAGYYEVQVEPLPGCKTDMIIQAHKSAAEIWYPKYA